MFLNYLPVSHFVMTVLWTSSQMRWYSVWEHTHIEIVAVLQWHFVKLHVECVSVAIVTNIGTGHEREVSKNCDFIRTYYWISLFIIQNVFSNRFLDKFNGFTWLSVMGSVSKLKHRPLSLCLLSPVKECFPCTKKDTIRRIRQFPLIFLFWTD